MPDPLTKLTAAIATAKKIREISKALEHAELKGLVADLSMELAELKGDLADAKNENVELRSRIQELTSARPGDPCPQCGAPAWRVKGSEPHPSLGMVGAINRTYGCGECGFEETHVVTP